MRLIYPIGSNPLECTQRPRHGRCRGGLSYDKIVVVADCRRFAELMHLAN